MGMRITIASVLAALAIAAPANAATYTGSATAYASCDGGTTITASGRSVQVGYVANNFLPLGTWIEMVSPKNVQGLRYFRVFDRGGPGFILDFWTDDCSWMNSFGRRTVTFRTVPKSEMYKGKPFKGWHFRKTRKGTRLVWRNK